MGAQKNQQNACSACTIYPLAFVFAAEALFSIIVGSPYISATMVAAAAAINSPQPTVCTAPTAANMRYENNVYAEEAVNKGSESGFVPRTGTGS